MVKWVSRAEVRKFRRKEKAVTLLHSYLHFIGCYTVICISLNKNSVHCILKRSGNNTTKWEQVWLDNAGYSAFS